MTDPGVLKELGIKRYRASVDHLDHSYEEPDGWPYVKLVEDAEKGDLIFAPALEAAIRRGDLIPRSKLEERLHYLKKMWQARKDEQWGRPIDTLLMQELVLQIRELERLLKETKP